MPHLPVNDPQLESIATKVDAGERLSLEDALSLFESNDLLGIGAMASAANRRVNGDRVLFSANQHINPTNVCVLRNVCAFCSFARTFREDRACTRSLHDVFAEAESARGGPTSEFHIVGGLHLKLQLSYHLGMIRRLRLRHPDVRVVDDRRKRGLSRRNAALHHTGRDASSHRKCWLHPGATTPRLFYYR